MALFDGTKRAMYFVVSETGAKYGPADIDTLMQWAAENRLTPASVLEDAATGVQISAAQVPGLFPPELQPSIQQASLVEPTRPPTSPYVSPGPYQENPYAGPDGRNRGLGVGESESAKQAVLYGWVCFALGLAVCPLISPGAIYFGKKAKDEGHPQGNLIFILGIVWTCFGLCTTLIGFLMLAGIAGSMVGS